MTLRSASESRATPPSAPAVASEDTTLLARVPFFQGLRAGQLVALAAVATSKAWAAGEPLLQTGRPAPGLMVLRRGRARGDSGVLGPGDVLEMLTAFDTRMAEETVIATEPVECLILTARAVHEAIRQDPELGVALLRDVSRFVSAPGGDVSEQLLRYAADVAESYREAERRQDALRQSVLGAVRGLVDLAEAKDPILRGHASHAAHIARALAVKLGWAADAVGHAALGGLLHDVGYIVVDSAILRKAGPLSEAEQRQIQSHPTVGARIIERIAFLGPVVPFVLHHHERYDGRGYPQGLTGKAIPLAGRLMAAVEYYETLRTGQDGPAGDEPRRLARLLRAEIGTRLDREVANALAELIESAEVPGG